MTSPRPCLAVGIEAVQHLYLLHVLKDSGIVAFLTFTSVVLREKEGYWRWPPVEESGCGGLGLEFGIMGESEVVLVISLNI